MQRPRLVLTFGDVLTVNCSHLAVSGPPASFSLEEGEEAALKAALNELKLDLHQIDPVVECLLPLRDIRLSRGMAGSSGDNGQIIPSKVADCLNKARTAAADVSPSWAGTRVWGDVSEIVIDGTRFMAQIPDQVVAGNSVRVEVLQAFCIPELESERMALLHSFGLQVPTLQHLSIVNSVESLSTKDERHRGIALICIDKFGAEIAVCSGGHIVALSSIPAAVNNPNRSLLEADNWLHRNDWCAGRLPFGIRLAGVAVSRDWFSRTDANISMPVSFQDELQHLWP